MSEHKPSETTGHEALSDALKVSFKLLRYLMLLLVLGYLASGVFVVNQHEKAFVLLYGKVSGIGADRIHGPGLHWTWPRPFTEVVRVPAERVQTVETGNFWYFEGEGDEPPPAGPTLRPGVDGYNLTADANLLHSKWTARYMISDPEAWYFRFNDVDTLIRNALDTAVVHVMARYPVDEALRTRIESVRTAVESKLRADVDALGIGIRIQGVALIPAAPRQVQQSFRSVVDAENAAAKVVLDARAYAASAVNQADGEAEKIRLQGEADRATMLSAIQADVAYFSKILEQYERNPKITVDNLRIDTVQRALAAVDRKTMVPAGKQTRILISPPKRQMGVDGTEAP